MDWEKKTDMIMLSFLFCINFCFLSSDGLGPYPTAKKVIEELITRKITKEEAGKFLIIGMTKVAECCLG